MRLLEIGLLLIALPLSSFAQEPTSKLTGTIYDPQGSVILKAKITATDTTGKKFETVSNEEGVYSLVLPVSKYKPDLRYEAIKYDLLVESPGFQPSAIKEYIFIPSQFGKMSLDFAMAVGCDPPCHEIEIPAKTSRKPE